MYVFSQSLTMWIKILYNYFFIVSLDVSML